MCDKIRLNQIDQTRLNCKKKLIKLKLRIQIIKVKLFRITFPEEHNTIIILILKKNINC